MSRVVIGVGHPARGDDGAGPAVARRLGGVEVSSPVELMAAWEGADQAIVVDAARSGARPGTVHRFDAAATPLPTGLLAASTHAVGVAEVVELARVMDRLPRQLVVYAIEVGDLTLGAPMSTPVAEAVRRLAEEIADA